MCLIIFAHRMTPLHPLLVAANRDEFHRRPTRPSHFWERYPSMVAGLDETMGGTWMGATREGKFAAVTNFRDSQALPPNARSRGELPLHFLTGPDTPKHYLQSIVATADQYAGFNLLIGDAQQLWYFSNRPKQPNARLDPPRALEPGVYGLSNAHLDAPWPKVELGKQRLAQLLQESTQLNHNDLHTLVSNTESAPVTELEKLGLGSETEVALSAQFICSKAYGTRSTTTLFSDSFGNTTSWQEVRYDEQGQPTGESSIDFHRS